MIAVTYPCDTCPDDECRETGCDRYSTAASIVCAGTRLARLVRESALPDDERRKVGLIFAAALTEALGLCSAHLDRDSFFRSCNVEVPS